MKYLKATISLYITAMLGSSAQTIAGDPLEHWAPLPVEERVDSVFETELMRYLEEEWCDRPSETASLRLTERDYEEVAAELGIEVAAIKAVVEIETGNIHQGFGPDGKPLINFDASMYRKYAPRHGVDLNKARKRSPEIFKGPNVRKYGSTQAAQYARLEAARAIDEPSALESTFWGMFQIGGFNWKICGAASVEDFVKRMARSEREQLELFAAFCRSRDLVKYIRDHRWADFSLRYNGPGYKSKRYDSRMAQAYKRYSSKK